LEKVLVKPHSKPRVLLRELLKKAEPDGDRLCRLQQRIEHESNSSGTHVSHGYCWERAEKSQDFRRWCACCKS
jgi:hypothetical protein